MKSLVQAMTIFGRELGSADDLDLPVQCALLPTLTAVQVNLIQLLDLCFCMCVSVLGSLFVCSGVFVYSHRC